MHRPIPPLPQEGDVAMRSVDGSPPGREYAFVEAENRNESRRYCLPENKPQAPHCKRGSARRAGFRRNRGSRSWMLQRGPCPGAAIPSSGSRQPGRRLVECRSEYAGYRGDCHRGTKGPSLRRLSSGCLRPGCDQGEELCFERRFLGYSQACGEGAYRLQSGRDHALAGG